MKKISILLLAFVFLLCSCGKRTQDCEIVNMIKSGNYYYKLNLEGNTITFLKKDGQSMSYQDDDKNIVNFFENGKNKIVDFQKRQYMISDVNEGEYKLFDLDGDKLEFSKKETVFINEKEYDKYEYGYYSLKIGFVYDGDKWTHTYVLFPNLDPNEISYIDVISYGDDFSEEFVGVDTTNFSEVTYEEFFKTN